MRLLLPTEDVAEYQQHVDEWVTSLAPATSAERQVALLVADLGWRLKRVGRIEERRMLALLDDQVETTPEWQARRKTRDVTVALDTVAQLVASVPLPVPTTNLAPFLGGLRGIVEMLDGLRDALTPGQWPDADVLVLLRAQQVLVAEEQIEETVDVAFSTLGSAAAALAVALRGLMPALDAAVENARTALSTHTLLVDDEDRRFERHRRILESSIARQLDLLGKLRTLPASSSMSGSYERPASVELRVIS